MQIKKEYQDRVTYDQKTCQRVKEISLLTAMWIINIPKIFPYWFGRGSKWGAISLIISGEVTEAAIAANINNLFEIKSIQNPEFGIIELKTLSSNQNTIRLHDEECVLIWKYSEKRQKTIPWRYFRSNY